MFKLYTINTGILTEAESVEIDQRGAIANASWIDASNPDKEERQHLETFLNTELPESREFEAIEASARYYIDINGIHVHSLFLKQSEGEINNVSVVFILQPNRLITIREGRGFADFRLLRMRIRSGIVKAKSPKDLLITIFDQKVENLADAIEDIFSKLEFVSHQILKEENPDYEKSIEELGKLEDSNGKIRLCLMDTHRSLTFLRRHLREEPDLQLMLKELMQDIETLLPHTDFLFDKINFLMDASLGFINITQNQIIKTFSIAAVVFLPPTLIASIYGMNFEFLPELKWQYGYPLALFVMLLSGIAPYLIFKRKGWL